MTTRTPLSGRGVWIFPASYPVHIAEEYAVGGGFVAWAGREFGAALPMAEFIAWNVCAFGLLCLGAWLAVRDTRYRWIEIAVAVAFAGNALAHLLASAITWSYSPGLVTGVLLWAPLGVARGVPAYRASGGRGRRAGLLVGLAAVVVPLAVLGAEFRRAAPEGGSRSESAAACTVLALPTTLATRGAWRHGRSINLRELRAHPKGFVVGMLGTRVEAAMHHPGRGACTGKTTKPLPRQALSGPGRSYGGIRPARHPR